MSITPQEKAIHAMTMLEEHKGTLQPNRFGGWEWIRWVDGETVKTRGDTPAEAVLAALLPTEAV